MSGLGAIKVGDKIQVCNAGGTTIVDLTIGEAARLRDDLARILDKNLSAQEWVDLHNEQFARAGHQREEGINLDEYRVLVSNVAKLIADREHELADLTNRVAGQEVTYSQMDSILVRIGELEAGMQRHAPDLHAPLMRRIEALEKRCSDNEAAEKLVVRLLRVDKDA